MSDSLRALIPSRPAAAALFPAALPPGERQANEESSQ
jgi:hypothetical protein